MRAEPEVGCAPERRERCDARANRQLILAAARQLFAARGAGSTCMKAIAAAAGVGKGTLYRHFAHKGELCWALIKEDLAEFQERVGALIDGEQRARPALARLEIVIVERVRFMESHLPLFAALQTAAGERRDAWFHGPFDGWAHARIVALLGEALARGEVVELDIPFTADAILAAVSAPLYSYQRYECGYPVERIVAGMRRLFVEGLRDA